MNHYRAVLAARAWLIESTLPDGRHDMFRDSYRHSKTHWDDGGCTDVIYCYCCGKPHDVECVHIVRFIDYGAAICQCCQDKTVRPKLPVISLAKLNPALRKFECDVCAGKIDIGMLVHVVCSDGSEYRQPAKLRVDRVVYG